MTDRDVQNIILSKAWGVDRYVSSSVDVGAIPDINVSFDAETILNADDFSERTMQQAELILGKLIRARERVIQLCEEADSDNIQSAKQVESLLATSVVQVERDFDTSV
jgi:hypothetical protein